MNRSAIVASLLLTFVVMSCGCQPNNSENTIDSDGHTYSHSSSSHAADNSGPNEDRNDVGKIDPYHGIHGGHKFTLEPADYVGEWLVSREDNVTRIYLLDKLGTTDAPIKAELFEISRGDSVFTLDPENANSDGKTAVFSLSDQDLSIAINLGVQVKIVVAGQTYSGQISALKPHSH